MIAELDILDEKHENVWFPTLIEDAVSDFEDGCPELVESRRRNVAIIYLGEARR